MNELIKKFSHVVKGVITGFDRIVFKGWMLPLMHAQGAMDFCRRRGLLNKDYKAWMMEQSGVIVRDAAESVEKQCGGKIQPLGSLKIRKKDELARPRQGVAGAGHGLIGIWSAVEACSSYKAHFCAQSGYPQLKKEWTRCKHLYYYFDDEEFGLMSVRQQTWFPYPIQIALNGREWLRRSLEKCGCDFQMKGNKFLSIGDYELAQGLLDRQLRTRWEGCLNRFVRRVFPAMKRILGPDLDYYWTLWQCEWATDLIFQSREALGEIKDALIRQAWMTGTSTRVMRYFDCPLTQSGRPDARMTDEVNSRLLDYWDGLRVKHCVGSNSAKFYTEENNARAETTTNQPGKFKVHRRAQGEKKSAPKKRRPLRKGVADIALRAQVSQEINDRLMNQLATCSHETLVRQLLDPYCRRRIKHGRPVRALDFIGKDRALLQAISDPAFCVSGITNRTLREKLQRQPGYTSHTPKQICAKISRQLRLLRDHGLIRKMPRQNCYHLTAEGRQLTTTLNALLTASTQQLMAAAA